MRYLGKVTDKKDIINKEYSDDNYIQKVTDMPPASSDFEGTIHQYVGITTTDYTQGYFYKCVEVTPSTTPKTYTWERVDVQPSGGSSVVASASSVTGATTAKSLKIDGTDWNLPTGGGTVEIDGHTIVYDEDNKLKTSIGGYIEEAPEDDIFLTEGEGTKSASYTFTWATPSADIKRLYEEVAVNDINVVVEGEIDGVYFDGEATGTVSLPSSNEVRWLIRFPADSEQFRLYVSYNFSTEVASIRALTTDDVSTLSLNCKYVVSPAQTIIQPLDGRTVPMNVGQFVVDSHGEISLADMIYVELTETELTDEQVEFIQSHENIIIHSSVDGADVYFQKVSVAGDVYAFTAMTASGDVIGLALNVADKSIQVTSMSLTAVSASSTGTSTEEVQYITINDNEYKLAGGGGGSAEIDEKTIVKDADYKLSTAVGGYDTRTEFDGDIVKNATATETETKHFEFDIVEDTKVALSTTYKTASAMKVAMYNKVTIAGTDFEHRMTVNVNHSEDGVWTVTLYLSVAGVDLPIPIEINANEGKMKCDFTAVPDAYPIDSVFATASTHVEGGLLSYINNKFIKYDGETIVQDTTDTLKAIYGGGRQIATSESITDLNNTVATYIQDIGTFKMFQLDEHNGYEYFQVGNTVDIAFNFGGSIISMSDVVIKKYEEEDIGEFDAILLDRLFGSITYFTIIDRYGVIVSETITESEAETLICKGCTINYNNYNYVPIESKFVPYSSRFFYADSDTDLIAPKVQFGTWDESSEILNHIGEASFTISSGFILFDANRSDSVRAGNMVDVSYSITHATLGRVRAQGKGTFVQHSNYTWYASLEDMGWGDENIFQNIRISTNTTPATIQLQPINDISASDIVSIDDMTVRQQQDDAVDHPIPSKYLSLDGDTLSLNSDGEVQVKISAESDNKLEVKSDGLFVTASASGDYEEKTNKVSAWQTTVDDTHYPSEKLVKDNLDLKLAKADVVDGLTSTDTDKPLSANQGKILNEAKVNVSDIVDNITSTDTNKPLSANQGKVLSELITSGIVKCDSTTYSGYSRAALSSKVATPGSSVFTDVKWTLADSPDGTATSAWTAHMTKKANGIFTCYAIQNYSETVTNPVCNIYVSSSYYGTWTAWQKILTDGDFTSVSVSKSSGVSGDIEVYKQGKLINIEIRSVTCTSAGGSSGITIANLGSSYGCKNQQVDSAWVSLDGSETGILQIKNEGNIVLYGYPANTAVWGSITYFQK